MSRDTEIRYLYERVGIKGDSSQKTIRNTLNLGTINKNKLAGVSTASSGGKQYKKTITKPK